VRLLRVTAMNASMVNQSSNGARRGNGDLIKRLVGLRDDIRAGFRYNRVYANRSTVEYVCQSFTHSVPSFQLEESGQRWKRPGGQVRSTARDGRPVAHVSS